MEVPPINARSVDEAAKRLAGKIQRTALLESLPLNNLLNARLLVKAECNQTAGSFKIRGAMNRVLTLSPEMRAKGVVAFSSGNFGQGLAAACGALGVRCTIVMPGDAPTNKQERARSYGSDVVLSEIIEGINREVTAAELAESLSQEFGYVLLHPFEDWEVMAGQGTCALEICEQCRELGISSLDALLIPIGGGGLTAGCCLIMEREMPECAVYAVEPEGYDDHVKSLALGTGERVRIEGNPPSLCDSLQAVAPGEHTFPITRRILAGAMAVSDAEVRHAMRVAFETLQVVLEPGGAVALAAVLFNKVPGGVVGKTLCVVGSGGNLSVDKFNKCLGASERCLLPPMAPALAATTFDWTGIRVQRMDRLTKPLLIAHSAAPKLGGKTAYVACGYVSMEMADKLEEVVGIVLGVSKAEDMLAAELVAVSAAGERAGMRVGMSGSEALRLIQQLPASAL